MTSRRVVPLGVLLAFCTALSGAPLPRASDQQVLAACALAVDVYHSEFSARVTSPDCFRLPLQTAEILRESDLQATAQHYRMMVSYASNDLDDFSIVQKGPQGDLVYRPGNALRPDAKNTLGSYITAPALLTPADPAEQQAIAWTKACFVAASANTVIRSALATGQFRTPTTCQDPRLKLKPQGFPPLTSGSGMTLISEVALASTLSEGNTYLVGVNVQSTTGQWYTMTIKLSPREASALDEPVLLRGRTPLRR